jgi:lipoic acid synthetase
MSSLPIVPAPSPARPAWLRVRAPGSGRAQELLRLVEEKRLHTVCSSAACPNLGECWSLGTATFMILGNECTRACRFCDVKTSTTPRPVDLDEPARLAEAAALLGLSHVVITSVARDDLDDGGAAHFVRCMSAVRARIDDVAVEVLIPDFGGADAPLALVVDARPDVLNHNLETCERLTPKIRSRADYRRSLDLLARAKARAPRLVTKSGLMLGLGETDDEIEDAIRDLRGSHVDVLTLGQYLRPSSWHAPVERYVPPERFAQLADFARAQGFAHVEAGPLVRSSYHAERALPSASARVERA